VCAGLALPGAREAAAAALLDVYLQARQDDPVYLAALRQGEAAREFVEQAKSLGRPNVSLALARANTNTVIHRSPGDNVYALGSRSFPGAEYALTVVQPVYNAVSSATRVQADARAGQVDAEREAAEQDLAWRVVDRYCRAAAAREGVLALDAEIVALQAQRDRVAVRQAAGLARNSELLEVRARLGDAQARAAEARMSSADALRGLTELTGQSLTRLDLLDKGLPAALLDPIPQDAVELASDHPLVIARRQAVRVAEAELMRQQGASRPTVDASLKVGRTRANGSLFGGGSDIETNELRLSLNLPLYSGGMLSSREREAARLLERAQEDRRATQRTVEREIATALDRIREGRIRHDALLEAVLSGEEAVRTRQLAYQAGIATNLAVLDASRELARARADHARARYELALAVFLLKRATGAIGVDDIRRLDALLVPGPEGAPASTTRDSPRSAS
jgi:outer membrane protein